MGFRAEALLPVQEEAEESRFQEECKHSFHSQGLPNHAAGGLRKMRPVGSKLKFQRYAGHNSDDEVNAENARPETCGFVVHPVIVAQSHSFQPDDQWGKAYC